MSEATVPSGKSNFESLWASCTPEQKAIARRVVSEELLEELLGSAETEDESDGEEWTDADN